MMRPAMIRVTIAWAFALVTASQTSAQSCPSAPMMLQILGSGGPAVNAERASAGYVVWTNGQARIMVDAGGGTFLRFGQTRAQLADLWLLALSHLHPDHVSDLPALLWLSHQVRKEPLLLVGPSGNDAVPDVSAFLARLFDQKTGVFQVLGGTLGGAGNGVRLETRAVDVTKAERSTVLDRPEITVTAMGIPHGNIPALAYRVQEGRRSIVLSTDQTGTSPAFIDFARGADVLVMHLATIADNSPLHAAPAVVGRVARDAGARRLVLSHIGQFDLEAAVAGVKKYYTGPVTVGADLQCTAVP